MKNFIPYFFSFLPAFAGLHAQTARIDSLRTVLASTRDWQQRIDIQRSIAYGFHGLDTDSSMYYGEQMLRASEQHHYNKGLGLAWQLIGETHLYKAENEKALSCLLKSEAALRAAGDKQNLAIVLANTAYTLELMSRFGESGDKIVAGIELAREMNDSTTLADTYRYFASLLMKQKHPDYALDNLRKGLAIWLRKGNNPHYFYSAIGEAFSMLRQRDSTFYYAEKALEAAEQSDTPRYIASEHSCLGRYCFIYGEYEQARAHYLQALAYFEKTGSNINLPNLYNNTAENENALGNHRMAHDYAQKALNFVASTRNFLQISAVHYNLYKSYEGLGDQASALREALLWKAATDSLNQIDNARKVAEVENQYRTREQEVTIAQQQLQLERQQNRQHVLLLGALLLLAAAAGLAFFLRSKRQGAEHALQLKAAETLRLQEQDKMKSAFFANISHEFRTPLTLILGPLRQMEQGVFKGNAVKYFGIMRRNAERLLQLINQLLDLSRLESGRLQLQPQPGDLTGSLRVMGYAFESLADQRQISYNIALPETPLTALFDRDKLEIIVTNLLSNAFKFTPEEGTVEFSARKMQEVEGKVWVEIKVADSGIGIPAGQQAHIFERFYQIENTGSDLQPGSGIGLALTKEIVTLHGGTISLESPVGAGGSGTAFTVVLPLHSVEFSSQMLEQEEFVSNSALQPLPEKRSGMAVSERDVATRHLPLILVVEDNADVRTYVVEQLRGQARVLEAADGRAALDIARAELPDLILSDLMMPVMDGIALIRLLKADEHTSHIPVILLTAKAGRPDRMEGLETGAEAYLTKPFDAAELQLVVRKTIAQRQVLREKFSREIRLGLTDVATASVDDLFLQKVLACIEENLDDDQFGVEQLAAGLRMSRSNLFRKLDALTGKSPTTIIRDLRLARAKSLLEQDAGNTAEVAFMVGFNSSTYFIKCFTDAFGMPPGEVRKKGIAGKSAQL